MFLDHNSLDLSINTVTTLLRADGSHEVYWNHNIICQAGKNGILSVSGVNLAAFSYVGIGSGVTIPTVSDTALQSEFARQAATTLNPQASTYQVTAVWGPGSFAGNIGEAGIFNAPTGGLMLARQLISTGYKNINDTLTIVWLIT
jgi:hypothetical protein